MTDTLTTNYGWTMPGDHVNTNTWGGLLNADLQAIDNQVMANTQGLVRVGGILNDVVLTKATSHEANVVFQGVVGTATTRWVVGIDSGVESLGSNANSNFHIYRYDDNGNFLDVPMSINRATATVVFNGQVQSNGSAGTSRQIFGTTAGVPRWGMALGDGAAESGSNAGSNFILNSYTDAGTYLTSPLTINRASGKATFTAGATFAQFIQIQSNGGDSALNLVDPGGNPRGQCLWQYSTNNVTLYNASGAGAAWLGPDAIFYVSNNGFKPGGGTWGVSSDARIKTVEGDFTPGLEEVAQLRPVVYSYLGNDTPTEDLSSSLHGEGRAGSAPYPASPHYGVAGKPFVGLVAQEVEAVFPGMVNQRAGFIDGVAVSDLRDIDTTPLLFALINAVKELKAEVEALKAGAS